MQIEGKYNEETRELRLVVNFDDDEQHKHFRDRFFAMCKQMAEDKDGIMIDATEGLDNMSEEDQVNIKKLLSHIANQVNQEMEPKFKSKFL
jgi:hypothetical protein